MVLKEAAKYTFCNNFTNTRDTGMKLLHSGVSFSWLPPLLWKLPCFLCDFDTQSNLLIDGHDGPAGAQ